jgi:hypothetical protein
VDSLKDLARYIPLNQGWTGFSLFTEAEQLEVESMLSSLRYVSEGDWLVSSDRFAQYSDSLGWYNVGEQSLSQMNAAEGYMIYLSAQADTLRTVGAKVNYPVIDLDAGWNWLSFPFENAEEINTALDNIINISNADTVKVDYPLPGSFVEESTYDIMSQNWDSNTLPWLKANQLYKLYIQNPNGGQLQWTTVNNGKR